MEGKEGENLLTCRVCQKEFDATKRVPKFLPCLHTFCLVCLNKMKTQGGATIKKCPTCHKVCDVRVAELPVNDYVLYILNMRSKMEADAVRMPSPNKTGPSWCLLCDMMAKPECYTQDHGLLYLTSGTMKNVERLVSLKNEFRNIKKQLMKAIEERKKIKIHYTELLDAIHSIESDIQSKLDENEKQLADWTTLSENNFLVVEQRQGSPVPNGTESNPGSIDADDFFQLITSVGSSGKEKITLETWKMTVEKTSQKYDEKIAKITAEKTDIEEQRKMRISVRMCDPSKKDTAQPIGEILCEGFVIDELEGSKSVTDIEKNFLLLLSHIVFTLHKQRKPDRFL